VIVWILALCVFFVWTPGRIVVPLEPANGDPK